MTADLDAWHPWHPREVAARLAGVDAPWYVAAGWAVELHLTEFGVTDPARPHEDLEIAVPAPRFGQIAERFGDCDFYTVGNGEALPWPERSAEFHQTWAWDRAARVWRFDVFREPSEAGLWVCRRDPSIRMPYAELILRTGDGIPYLRPEVALLFKAKATRTKDEADFAAVLPVLTAVQRSWLAGALDTVHPGHPWRAALSRR
ncbi:MAG: hypothetical protein ACRDTM_12580 [Micromonosporaceae bacterium]